MKLHEAIRYVIKKYGINKKDYQKIADIINKQSLYQRKDCEPVPARQISARISKYEKRYNYDFN